MMFCLIRAQRPCERKKHNKEGWQKPLPQGLRGRRNSPPLQPATSRLNSGLELSGKQSGVGSGTLAGKRE